MLVNYLILFLGFAPFIIFCLAGIHCIYELQEDEVPQYIPICISVVFYRWAKDKINKLGIVIVISLIEIWSLPLKIISCIYLLFVYLGRLFLIIFKKREKK